MLQVTAALAIAIRSFIGHPKPSRGWHVVYTLEYSYPSLHLTRMGR